MGVKRRKDIPTYWKANPLLKAVDVANVFGVSVNTALRYRQLAALPPLRRPSLEKSVSADIRRYCTENPHLKDHEVAAVFGVEKSNIQHIRARGGIARKRGAPNKYPRYLPCIVCGVYFTLSKNQAYSEHVGRQRACCSAACVKERQKLHSVSEDSLITGPEHPRWKHGLYSKTSREASILVAAIRRLTKEGPRI
jgi:hypothetical protein